MKKCATDNRLIAGFLFAHLLIFFSFEQRTVFWYIFTATMLFLISFSILNEDVRDSNFIIKDIIVGAISGLSLFFVFLFGNKMTHIMNLPFKKEISQLYDIFSPTFAWHYIVLFLIIIPGEELFWRGFIQKRILQHTNFWTSIVLTTLLYTSVQFYSGTYILPIAALVSGLFWGYLYNRKKSIIFVIASHFIFDLFLLVIFPLN